MKEYVDHTIEAWTDYPIAELGDKPWVNAPIRPCLVIEYDGDKYATVIVGRITTEFKSGYLYLEPGRCGEVPCIPRELLTTLKEDNVKQ